MDACIWQWHLKIKMPIFQNFLGEAHIFLTVDSMFLIIHNLSHKNFIKPIQIEDFLVGHLVHKGAEGSPWHSWLPAPVIVSASGPRTQLETNGN